MTSQTRKAQQSEATRGALLAAARQLFAERGFAGTATEEIVERAGVTRGALYHHFRDKEDLFRAVHDEVHVEVEEKIHEAGKSAPNHYDALKAGCHAFLESFTDPIVQRVMLLDARAVLDPGHMDETATRDVEMVKNLLDCAVEEGMLAPQPSEPLAHLILGAVHQGALAIATAPDTETASKDIGAAVERLLESLRKQT